MGEPPSHSPEAAPDHASAAPIAPSGWVRRFASLVRPGGAVLDLACGSGRHARLFLARGHKVTALDRELAGLGELRHAPGLEAIQADLEGAPWPLAGRAFAAVVVANYLWRPLFPHILAALESDGVLIYETFARGNARFGRPRNPEFLLAPGELLETVRGRLQVIAFEQGVTETPRPAAVQRLCAVNRAPEGDALAALPREQAPD